MIVGGLEKLSEQLEAGGIAPHVPTDAVGVLSRIRTEQRRLTWLLEALDRPRVPERTLLLLEDSLTALVEAGDALEATMNVKRGRPVSAPITHRIHPDAAYTSCCQLPPFELPRTDRITGTDDAVVTCRGPRRVRS
jgi:hypothetical protein